MRLYKTFLLLVKLSYKVNYVRDTCKGRNTLTAVICAKYKTWLGGLSELKSDFLYYTSLKSSVLRLCQRLPLSEYRARC